MIRTHINIHAGPGAPPGVEYVRNKKLGHFEITFPGAGGSIDTRDDGDAILQAQAQGVVTGCVFLDRRHARPLYHSLATALQHAEPERESTWTLFADALVDLLCHMREYDNDTSNGDPPAEYVRAVELARSYGLVDEETFVWRAA